MSDSLQARTVAASPASARKILVSGSWLLIENVLRLGITAGVSFWAARALGPADFGLLNAASALGAILFAIATLGLEVPAVLRLARGDPPGTVLGTLLCLRLWASLGALLLAAGMAGALRHGDDRAQAVMLIVALSVVGYVPTVFDYAFKACVEAGPPARARLATTVLSATAKAAVLLTGADVVAMAWTVVLEAVLASALMFRAWKRQGAVAAGALVSVAASDLRYDMAMAACLLRQAIPLLGAAAAVSVQLKSDVVLLGHLASDLQAGRYALAQKLSEVLYVVPVVLVDSVYPSLARRFGASAQAAQEPSEQLMFDLAAAAGMMCSLACLLMARPLILGIFGAPFEATVPLWQLHGLTCTAVALDVARQRWLLSRGLQAQALHSALLGAALLVTLNLVFVPHFGAQAAAAAAVAAWWASGVLATCFWLRDDRVQALMLLQLRALWPWKRLWQQLRPQHGAGS